MSLKTIFSLLALTVVGSLSVAACAAPTDEAPAAPDENAEVQDAELRMASYNSCQADSDCVPVSKGGCCPNGVNVAVNKNKTSQYANAAKCKNPPKVCPIAMIWDQRTAQCNTGTKKCEMVNPEDIKCGGFVMNPKQCPAGYACDHNGLNPDVPGKCVKDDAPPPPPPVDTCANVRCVSGTHCEMKGINGGALPVCIGDAPPPPNCGANTCKAGSYCSFCFGRLACVPDGAMC